MEDGGNIKGRAFGEGEDMDWLRHTLSLQLLPLFGVSSNTSHGKGITWRSRIVLRDEKAENTVLERAEGLTGAVVC